MPTVRLYGPWEDGSAHIESGQLIQAGEYVLISAETIGDAIEQYGALHDASVSPLNEDIPDQEPQYFVIDEPAPAWAQPAYDIHVLRLGDEICPKQDLSFPLLEGDVIVMDLLVC